MKISNLIKIIVNKKTQYLVTFIQLRQHEDNHATKKYHLQKVFFDKLYQISSLTNRDYYNKYCKEYKLFNEINFNLFVCSDRINSKHSNSETMLETKIVDVPTPSAWWMSEIRQLSPLRAIVPLGQEEAANSGIGLHLFYCAKRFITSD